MTLRDGVVRVVGALGAANDMTPPCTNAGASGNIDDIAVLKLDGLVAGEVGVVDILYWLSTGREWKNTIMEEHYRRSLNSEPEHPSVVLGRRH